MNEPMKNTRCQWGCWGLAALIGLVIFIVCLSMMDMQWPGSLFIAALSFILAGLIFTWAFCGKSETGSYDSGAFGSGASVQTGAGTSNSGSSVAASLASSDAVATGASSGASAGAAAAAASATATTASSAETAQAAREAEVKPSASLAGQDELADRKGEWKYDANASESGDASEAAASKPEPKKAEPKKAAAKKAAPKKAAAKKADAKPAAKAKTSSAGSADAAATPDYDNDGVFEGKDEGKRPEALTAARAGGADDLKKIKGIGPKLEQLCNELGFYHFDQIAGWSADEVIWVNANLAGFKGRVSRDNWVEQAKLLASGAETEFSKRVDKGGVY